MSCTTSLVYLKLFEGHSEKFTHMAWQEVRGISMCRIVNITCRNKQVWQVNRHQALSLSLLSVQQNKVPPFLLPVSIQQLGIRQAQHFGFLILKIQFWKKEEMQTNC